MSTHQQQGCKSNPIEPHSLSLHNFKSAPRRNWSRNRTPCCRSTPPTPAPLSRGANLTLQWIASSAVVEGRPFCSRRCRWWCWGQASVHTRRRRSQWERGRLFRKFIWVWIWKHIWNVWHYFDLGLNLESFEWILLCSWFEEGEHDWNKDSGGF